MSILLVGTGQAGSAIDGANVTLTFDVAPLQGDVVYVFGGHVTRGATSYGPSTAGYTQVATVDGANCTFRVHRKVMGASPDTTVVCFGSANANDSAAYGAYVLRGVDNTTPEDATATTAGQTSSTNPDCPSITTVTNTAWVLAVAGDLEAGTVDTSITAPTGYSNLVNAGSVDTNAYTVGGAIKEISPAAAENPASFTNWSSTFWGSASVAVRPNILFAQAVL